MEALHQIKAIVEEEQAPEKDGGNEGTNAATNKKGKRKKTKKPPTLEEQHARLARLYVRYYGVLRQLEQWHDGMAQPQIRQDIKVVLELVICRILALRGSLVQLLSSGGSGRSALPFPGCIDVASTLQTMKLSPSVMNPVIPRYIREESAHHRRRRRDDALELVLALPIDTDATASVDDAKENSHTCTNKNEKSSCTASSTAAEDQESHADANVNPSPVEAHLDSNYSAITKEEAATKVQSVARGHIGRAQTILLREQEAVFVGMKSETTAKTDELQCSSRYAYDRRKQKQRENEEALEVALDEVREEVRKEEGSNTYERLYEERMRWISDQISVTVDVPESLEGFYLKVEPNADADADADAGNGAQEGKTSSKKSGGSSAADTAQEDPDGDSNNNRELRLLHDLLNSVSTFEQRWNGKMIDGGSCDRGVAKEYMRQEIEQSITQSVDESVTLYLQRLRASNDAGAGKKSGKSGDAKKKGATNKGSGGSKKKKEKPLPGEKMCSSMDTSDMLQILMENKMVIDCSRNHSGHLVEDFVGFSDALSSSSLMHESSGKTTSNKSDDTTSGDSWDRKDPSMNQLQLAVAEYCIFPNASSTIKESLPDGDNVRAILLHGPQGCGKRDMMKAVANQLGALLITLSPEMIKDHFLDKIEATRLIHMIFTVARDDRFGPVLLNIDECEQFFQSSTGKQVDRSGPVRFQKDLLIYKNQAIEKKDRVVIIGTTAHPELLDPKIIKYKGPGGKPEKQGMFEKYLFFPPPNYVDRLLLWKSFVNEDPGEKVGDGERVPSKLHRKCIDFSLLASKSEGYTAGRIRRSVELARKLSDTSETGSGSNQSRALSENVLLAQLESFDAVGNEDRMRFVNFAKAMEQKSKSAAGAGDKKAGDKAKASK